MKLLLDTHTFIWWDSEPAKLARQARSLCADPENELLLSVASVWEMQIKQQLGKLKVAMPLANLIQRQQAANRIRVLPIELAHVLALERLPSHHRDPFDRLLVAQADGEVAILVSADPVFAHYPVRVVWD